ncbi:MAG: hypothetical protein H6738_18865 [Alphaproteobacteria bacterium]|nr:hypothetical protein [Alphaproteobacteria bacterium]MCB9698850.1 hypothetical protein [Alphaproteobacteria bacterium]
MSWRRWGFLVALTLPLLGADWRALVSPGVLTKGHDEFAGNCDACHLVFDGVPDAKCLGCHTDVAGRIASLEGWHAQHQDQRCSTCHPDHRGSTFVGTTDEALLAFDHGATGFALRNAHARQKCDDCHGERKLDQLADGCALCHDDPHGSALGPDCGTCHVDTGFLDGLKRLVDHQTEMTGGHAGIGCDGCHTQGDHLKALVACSECHEEAHGGTVADCAQCHQVSGFKPAEFDHGPCTCAFPGKHQTVGCLECHADYKFTDTPILCGGCHEKDRKHEPLGECARCHTATSWSEGEFDHDTAKFKVEGAHLAVSCTQCHTEAGVFRGAPTACDGCHHDAGMEAHGDFGACERCHVVAGFAPSTFDHATTGFPLTGKHIDQPCQGCHAQKVQGYPK